MTSHRHGVRLMSAILVISLLIFVLLSLTAPQGFYDVSERAIMLAMRAEGDPSLPAGPGWLAYFAEETTALGGWPLLTLLSLGVVGFFLLRKEWRYALILAAVVIGESVIVGRLKILFARERPEFLTHLVEATSKSFPSGHAASAAAIYLTLGLIIAAHLREPTARRYVIGVMIGLATLIGLSRIYLGVHYPSDVIAGWSVGSAWAAGVWLIAHRLSKSA